MYNFGCFLFVIHSLCFLLQGKETLMLTWYYNKCKTCPGSSESCSKQTLYLTFVENGYGKYSGCMKEGRLVLITRSLASYSTCQAFDWAIWGIAKQGEKNELSSYIFFVLTREKWYLGQLFTQLRVQLLQRNVRETN